VFETTRSTWISALRYKQYRATAILINPIVTHTKTVDSTVHTMSMSPPRSCDEQEVDFHPMNKDRPSAFSFRRPVHSKKKAISTAKKESRRVNIMRATNIRIDATQNSLVYSAKCGLCRITVGNTNTVFSITTCTSNCIMVVTGENQSGIISKRFYPVPGKVVMVPACDKYVIYWKRLSRAHTPVFMASELDHVFLKSWSVHTSLMVQKRDANSFNGVVMGPDYLRCIHCGKMFPSMSEWTSHYSTYRVPQNLPWYSVSISDGTVDFQKSQIKLTPSSIPRPHRTDTERSLIDQVYSAPKMISAVEKLERFIHATES